MQRNEMVALVAGGTVGLGGGALGAFLACTLGQAVAHRLLDPSAAQSSPRAPAARLAGQAEPASAQDLPHLPPVTVTVAVRACGLPAPQR